MIEVGSRVYVSASVKALEACCIPTDVAQAFANSKETFIVDAIDIDNVRLIAPPHSRGKWWMRNSCVATEPRIATRKRWGSPVNNTRTTLRNDQDVLW